MILLLLLPQILFYFFALPLKIFIFLMAAMMVKTAVAIFALAVVAFGDDGSSAVDGCTSRNKDYCAVSLFPPPHFSPFFSLQKYTYRAHWKIFCYVAFPIVYCSLSILNTIIVRRIKFTTLWKK